MPSGRKKGVELPPPICNILKINRLYDTLKSVSNRLSIAAVTVGILLVLAFAWPSFSFAQSQSGPEIALKSNILYDATTTPNIGIEIETGKKNTLQLFYGLNPWRFNTDGSYKQAKHWVLMPEYRWWRCSNFNGFFYGVHLMGGQFNAANVNLPIPGFFFSGDNIAKGVRDTRYEGTFAGLGLSYGYQWVLTRHWNLEAELALGYNHVWYSKYRCQKCGAKVGSGNSNYLGATKVALSMLYLF